MSYGPADKKVWTWPTPDGRRFRRAGTALSPLAFMLVYMVDTLIPFQTKAGPVISFSEFHLALCEEAKHWISPRGRRTGVIAPRGGGKSTMLFEVLPLWALAHGHRKFFMGYAHSNDQATEMLDRIRDQLTTNHRLLYDYPELWTFKGGRNSQQMVETRPDVDGMLAVGFSRQEALQIYRAGGRVFSAAGIDKGTLGKSRKVGRPDFFAIDDGEPDEAGYARRGKDGKHVRLKTIRDVILPMNSRAAVLLSGTVVMPGSIAHDLVRAALGEPTEDWVEQEGFNAAYFNAIQDENNPLYERSLWPEWRSLEWLKRERATNPGQYALHYANQPMTSGGQYWQETDIQRNPHFPIDHYIMYVDPAEVAEEGRDKTAWVVVGFDRPGGRADRAVVLFAHQGHFNDVELGHQIAGFKRDNPQIPILDVYVEGFNSGQLRYNTLRPLMPPGVHLRLDRPPPMLGPAGERGKTARIARAFAHYRAGKVWHLRPFSELESMMTSYPKVRNDDALDALAGALRMGFGD